jgi:hypothetical protein
MTSLFVCVRERIGRRNHLLLRDFEPYGIIFMNVCVVITVVALTMLSRDFGHYGILFLIICDFPVIIDDQFTNSNNRHQVMQGIMSRYV